MVRLQVAAPVVSIRVGGLPVEVEVVPMYSCSYQVGGRDKVANQVIVPVEMEPMSVTVIEVREYKTFNEC